MPEWWDNLTNSLGFAEPEPEPKRGSKLMTVLAPAIEQGQVAPHELALLKGISEYANDYPIPKEVSPGRKLLGGGFQAIGAGLARGAGASVEGALQPTQNMVADWNHRRDLADQGRVGAWKAAGDNIIPAATAAIARAQELERVRQLTDAQRRNMGQAPIYDAKPAPAAAVPTPAAPPPAAAPAPPTAAAPGAAPPASAPPGAPSAPATPAPSGASPPSDRPYIVGSGSNAPAFQTREWADWFKKAIDGYSLRGVLPPPIVSKDKDGNTIKDVIQHPEDILRVALEKDAEAYKGSDEYQTKKMFREKNTERSFETAKEYEAAAAAARKSNADLAQFSNALFSHIQEGGKTGVAQDWATTLKAWANGIPGVNFDISRVEEMRKASIGAATKMMRASLTGPTSDREMKTFLDTVTNASMSTQGNLRLLPFLKLQNDAQLEVRQLAGQLMEKNNGQLPWDFPDRAEAIMQKYQKEAARLGNELVADYKAGKLGPQGAAGQEGAAAGPTPEALEQAKGLYAKATPEQQAKMAEAWKAKGYDPAELGQPSAAAKTPSAAPPETGWNPGKPGTVGGAIKSIGKWFSAPNPASAEELDRIRRLKPNSPRDQLWVP